MPHLPSQEQNHSQYHFRSALLPVPFSDPERHCQCLYYCRALCTAQMNAVFCSTAQRGQLQWADGGGGGCVLAGSLACSLLVGLPPLAGSGIKYKL